MKTATETPWHSLPRGLTVGDAKNIIVKPIAAKDANRIIKALHYSGKVVTNSQLHLGVFLNDRVGGAMQFGPSLDKRKMLSLVSGTLWNEFLELNRLAFADWLPRNGESRAIAYTMRFIKKTYPWIKWIISFADGTQCGDGTIYRASGFHLIKIKPNTDLWKLSNGEISHAQSLKQLHFPGQRGEFQREAPEFMQRTHGKASPIDFLKSKGLSREILKGFQLLYIYFLDPTAKDRLTVPILPFSEIERRGAGMYKGIKRDKQAIGSDQEHSGGAAPTVTLQNAED
jgi:hypothetical protein